MATIINDRDKLLQATVPRIEYYTGNYIVIDGSAQQFKVSGTSTVPENIILTARLVGTLTGTVTWSVVSGTASFTTNGNSIDISGVNLTTDTATFKASLDYFGLVYESSYTISKVSDGQSGITVSLSKPVLTIPSAADGSNPDLTNASSTISVFEGSVDTTTSWTATALPSSGVAGNLIGKTYTVTGFTADTGYVDFTLSRSGYSDQTIQLVLAKSKAGSTGAKTAAVRLYQWATTQPGNPSGTSTYTWNPPSNANYTGGNNWQVSVPSNPGTPLLKLWIAEKNITADGTAATTSVSWSSGYSIYDATQNGATGTQSANPTVYRWALTIPTISGTSTYTWSSNTFTPVPTGWSTTSGTSPSPGYTLWAARVNLVTSATDTTSSINWSTASITAVGYAGADGDPGAPGTPGLSSRVAFARVANNPTPVSGNITTTGSTDYPTSTQSNTTWGFSATWSAVDPNPSSTNSLYQTDGIYNPSTNQTTWGTPYISSLKVGSLSAVSVNTGSLTVNGALTVNSTGYIVGGKTSYTDTTAGYFLGYSSGYKFNIGSATQYLKWDGTNMTIESPTFSLSSTTATFKSGLTGSPRIEITSGSSASISAISSSGSSLFSISASGIGSKGAVAQIMGPKDLTKPIMWVEGGSSGAVGYFNNSQNGAGVHGLSTGTDSTGVLGDGTLYGVHGKSGVIAVYGYSAGTGVKGQSIGGSPSAYGVHGTSAGEGLGVYGVATTTNGTNHGIRGTNTAVTGAPGGLIGAANGYSFYAEGINGQDYGTFTGSHDALLNVANVVPETGDIVLDTQVCYKAGISNVITVITRSTSAMQKSAVGVFVREIGLLGTGYIPNAIYHQEDPNVIQVLQDTYKYVCFNGLGEGQINVCGENGNIEIGDLIVTSSIPGKGMRQSDDIIRNYTVAKAREAATFDTPDQVKQIACIYLCG